MWRCARHHGLLIAQRRRARTAAAITAMTATTLVTGGPSTKTGAVGLDSPSAPTP